MFRIAPMVTGRQIRAAMAMIGWSLKTLAERSGVPWATVQRMQHVNGHPKQGSDRVAAVQKVLEAEGVEFRPDGSVGFNEKPRADA
jgi:alkylated DNA nucleotide flippase Atl1